MNQNIQNPFFQVQNLLMELSNYVYKINEIILQINNLMNQNNFLMTNQMNNLMQQMNGINNINNFGNINNYNPKFELLYNPKDIYNFVFEKSNGNSITISINKKKTINELLNAYFQKIGKSEYINNYNTIGFHYNFDNLVNLKEEKIEKILNYGAKINVSNFI